MPQAMLPVHSGPWKAPKMILAKEDAKWNAYKTVENRLRVPHRKKMDWSWLLVKVDWIASILAMPLQFR